MGVGLAAHIAGYYAQEGRSLLFVLQLCFGSQVRPVAKVHIPLARASVRIPKAGDYLLSCVHGQGQMAGVSQMGLRTALHSYTYLKPLCSCCVNRLSAIRVHASICL